MSIGNIFACLLSIRSEDLPFLHHFLEKYYFPLNQTFRKRGPSFLAIFWLLEERARKGQKTFLIVETGSLRAEPIRIPDDGASTILFDDFVQHYQGAVHTVDLDSKCQEVIARHCSGQVVPHTGDSVSFLTTFEPASKIDVLYLDSYDLDVEDPEPSAQHHLKEIEAIFSRLAPSTIIIVDDNLEHEDRKIGKGYLVEQFLKEKGIPLLYDGYQKVFQIAQNPSEIQELQTLLLRCDSFLARLLYWYERKMRRLCRKLKRLKGHN